MYKNKQNPRFCLFLSFRKLLLLSCNFLNYKINLVLNRSTNRTYACTASAFDASVCIDNVLVISFADAINRTFRSTCSAADTIVSNLVCHLKHLLTRFWVYLFPTYSCRKIFVVIQALLKARHQFHHYGYDYSLLFLYLHLKIQNILPLHCLQALHILCL